MRVKKRGGRPLPTPLTSLTSLVTLAFFGEAEGPEEGLRKPGKAEGLGEPGRAAPPEGLKPRPSPSPSTKARHKISKAKGEQQQK